MRRIAPFLAVAALLGVLTAAPAEARPSAAQKLFRDKLLKDSSVSRDVKTRLRKGGFVDREITFVDLTADGRSDAVVMVHSGGTAGRIALFIFSAGPRGSELRIVYRNQRLYRARGRVPEAGEPGEGTVYYTVPAYKRGDELCCASNLIETQLRWSASKRRFGVARRRVLDNRPRSERN